MRSVQVTAFGGPEVLQPADLPEPDPGPGEVLVDVDAAEVLFLDTQLRAGWGGEYFAIRPPYVPGVGVAGTVVDVGGGVEPSWRGRRVIAGTSGPGEYRGGGYAERSVVPVAMAHEIPAGVDAVPALAVLHDGVMAVSRLQKAGLASGDTALVTAATGGIGSWLVPLLRDAGISVVAAAGGARKVALAAQRGADIAVDYNDDWVGSVGRTVDVVFDGAGGPRGVEAFSLLRDGGRFFSYGAAAGGFPDVPDVADEAGRRGIDVVGMHDGFSADDMKRAGVEALDLLAQGSIVPVIGQIVPLEKAADAHAAFESRQVVGKTVLVP